MTQLSLSICWVASIRPYQKSKPKSSVHLILVCDIWTAKRAVEYHKLEKLGPISSEEASIKCICNTASFARMLLPGQIWDLSGRNNPPHHWSFCSEENGCWLTWCTFWKIFLHYKIHISVIALQSKKIVSLLFATWLFQQIFYNQLHTVCNRHKAVHVHHLFMKHHAFCFLKLLGGMNHQLYINQEHLPN